MVCLHIYCHTCTSISLCLWFVFDFPNGRSLRTHRNGSSRPVWINNGYSLEPSQAKHNHTSHHAIGQPKTRPTRPRGITNNRYTYPVQFSTLRTHDCFGGIRLAWKVPCGCRVVRCSRILKITFSLRLIRVYSTNGNQLHVPENGNPHQLTHPTTYP